MKTITKSSLVLLLIIICNIRIHGQEEPSIIEHEIYPNWYYIDNEYNSGTRSNVSCLTTANFIPVCKSEFNLTVNDELVVDNIFSVNDVVSSTNSSVNNKITKYQQYYKGYKVESSLIFTQDTSDTINLVLGALVDNLNLDTSNPISKELALSIAINSLEFPPMYLDTAIMNGWCLEEDGSFDSICYNSFLPRGELCISRKATDDFESNNFCFVWKYDIIATNGNEYRVLVNARNGNVYDVTNITKNGYGLGDVQTEYDGYYENAMETYRKAFVLKWRLKNSNGNITKIQNEDVKRWINEWTDEEERSAATAHWVIYELDDYYENVFNNTDITNDVKINIEKNYHVSEYSNNLIHISDYYGYSFAAIDIIGHELAHKLVIENVNLEYSFESGALHESFADIFGVMSERFVRSKYGKPWNWTIGENVGLDGLVRSFSNPKIYNQPDYYKGENWSYGNGDHGGVHCNSGVQNKWFYNLSQSIGVEKAELIAYTTLCGYLTPTSQYHDALFASAFATKSLYGECSEEWNAVISAWRNVGISSNSLLQCYQAGNNPPPAQRMAIDEDETYNNITIYPNPADNYIIVELPNNLLNGNIILYNQLGIVEYECTINSDSIRIETDNLSNGIHYIKVISDNHAIKVQKIIINK